MSPRERNLLAVLIVMAAALLGLFGLSAFFDRLAVLDRQYLALEKRGVQALQTATANPQSQEAYLLSLRGRFLGKEPLPEPIAFATAVQTELKAEGMSIEESRVLISPATESWIQFQGRGEMSGWFGFLRRLASDSHAIVRAATLIRKEGGGYTYSLEVGHALAP